MDPEPETFYMATGIIGLTLLYLFFLASIAAINRSRGKRIRELTRENKSRSRNARLILFKAEQCLQSLHAGLFLSALVLGYISIEAVSGSGIFLQLVNSLPVLAKSFLLEEGGKALFFLIIAEMALVLTILSRALSYAMPERILLLLSPMILFCHRIMAPVIWPVKSVARLILSMFGIGLPTEFERPLSAEELSEMVELSTKAGEIEQQEQEMIESVFVFSDTLVEEVMTPRGDISSIAMTASFGEVLEKFKREGFSRLVVVGTDLDDVKGIALSKDLFAWIGQDIKNFSLQKILRKPFFVQHSRKIGDLLRDMRRDKTHLAIVLDEHGGVDGIVTVEDLIEELVGEIHDEFDHGEVLERPVKDRDDISIEGSASIDDVNDRFGLSLPHGEYDTVAGLVLALLGKIPEPGEIAILDGLNITVSEIEQNRITRLRIQRAESIDSDETSVSQNILQSPENTKEKGVDSATSVAKGAANLK